jgi:Domain of unknown function DUF302
MAGPRLLRTLTFEHRALECARSFEEVHAALIDLVPVPKPEVSEILVRGGTEKVAAAAMQYEIGNPLTAERMTRHVLAAGLYAPLRVALYEDESGQAIFEYDLPSSLFGQFGDERVTEGWAGIGCRARGAAAGRERSMSER